MRKQLFILSLMVFFACGPNRVSTLSTPIQKTEKITVTDLVLKNLNLVSLKSKQTDSGRLKVVLEMQNEKGKDLWTDVQIAFYDADRVEVERTEWENFQWDRKAVKVYTKSALNKKAVDYRIFIRKIK